MADSTARLLLADVRTSMSGLQTAAANLVARAWEDARILAVRGRPPLVSRLLVDLRSVQADLRQRTEQALHDLDVQRRRLLSTLETRAASLVRAAAERLELALRGELLDLCARLAAVEQRLDALARDGAPREPVAGASCPTPDDHLVGAGSQG